MAYLESVLAEHYASTDPGEVWPPEPTTRPAHEEGVEYR